VDAVHLSLEELAALSLEQGAGDSKVYRNAYQALIDYVLGGYPGGLEGMGGAAELAGHLRASARVSGFEAWDQDWIVLQEAGLWMQLDCVDKAEELLVTTLRSPSAAQRAVELGVLGAQVAQARHDYNEAGSRLETARSALEELEPGFTRTDLEAQLAGAQVRLLLEIGLPDRAKEPLAREFEMARELFRLHGDRLRLDDALLDQVAQFQAEIEHAQVIELMRAGGAELPQPQSFAAWRLFVREATSRAELELLGSPPTDRDERDPVAMFRSALASGALLGFDSYYAREWLVSTLIDRGEWEEAEVELAQLRSAPELCRPSRFVDEVVVLESRLALARGHRVAFADLRTRAEQAWQEFLERWKPLAPSSELAPLYFEEVGKLARVLVDLNRELDGQARGSERSLAEFVLAQTVGSLAQALGARPPEWTEIRALLGAGELALLHLPVREQGRLLVIAHEGVSVHPLPPLPRIQDQRRRFTRALDRALADPDGLAWEELAEEGRRLAALLFPPSVVERVAAARALAVVAPENLGYVPFELLPVGAEAAFGLTHEVRYLPSLPVATALARRRAARPPSAPDAPKLAVFAADRPGTIEGASYPPLPIEAKGLEALASAFASDLTVAWGVNGDRAGLEALLAQRPRALFALAHGHVDRTRARPVALVLGGAHALLDASEVEGLAAPELVTLGTCGAWEGPRRRGDDGRAHLPSALLLAGADTVVAAESRLLFEPAWDLLTRFHAELGAGRTPAAALLEARRSIADAPTARERALALLVHVIGLGDRPLYPEGDPKEGSRSTKVSAVSSASSKEETDPGRSEPNRVPKWPFVLCSTLIVGLFAIRRLKRGFIAVAQDLGRRA
jgi:hypothetical protein